MAIWLPYKAKPHELKNRCRNERPRYCRICGKPTNNGGNTCKSCGDFIKSKQQEERKGKR